MTPTQHAPTSNTDLLGGLSFVVLWSTGYISAVFALEGTGPFTLSVVRFAGTLAVIGAWLLWRRAPRAPGSALIHAGIGGVLLQAGFFGFVYAGMRAGVPPAAAGLIAGLMPLTTALFAAVLLGERMSRSAVLGLGIGLCGVLFVVIPDLQQAGSALAYTFVFLALASLSLGTVYQKRHASGVDARLALVAQVGAASLVLMPLAWWIEGLDLHLTPASVGGIAWVILVNSCCGLLLYLWLLRRGAAGRVASLFFLVPPMTAVLAAIFLGARFGLHDAVGVALAAVGVWLGQRA
ncbi:MAG: DMT family transporter [Panacagrimonas sp.]